MVYFIFNHFIIFPCEMKNHAPTGSYLRLALLIYYALDVRTLRQINSLLHNRSTPSLLPSSKPVPLQSLPSPVTIRLQPWNLTLLLAACYITWAEHVHAQFIFTIYLNSHVRTHFNPFNIFVIPRKHQLTV